MSEEKLTDPGEFEWLVDSRARIHRLLLDLYSRTLPSTGFESAKKELALQLLVAIGFSLWRAAFLADGERTWPKMHLDQAKFLESLVRDNAIGYTQDRASRCWTFGYYLNNAYLRLSYLHGSLLPLTADHANRINAFLTDQFTPRDSEPNAKVAWEHAYEATRDAFRELSSVRRRLALFNFRADARPAVPAGAAQHGVRRRRRK